MVSCLIKARPEAAPRAGAHTFSIPESLLAMEESLFEKTAAAMCELDQPGNTEAKAERLTELGWDRGAWKQLADQILTEQRRSSLDANEVSAAELATESVRRVRDARETRKAFAALKDKLL